MKVPAMPNAHSHAFQRGLRGRAERIAGAGDDFWSWREAMYELAGELDPDSIEKASGAAYEEMAAAGYGAVGEFHYVPHRPDGTPYDDPNAMAKATARVEWAATPTETPGWASAQARSSSTRARKASTLGSQKRRWRGSGGLPGPARA